MNYDQLSKIYYNFFEGKINFDTALTLTELWHTKEIYESIIEIILEKGFPI